jgi:hypothetical protein
MLINKTRRFYKGRTVSKTIMLINTTRRIFTRDELFVSLKNVKSLPNIKLNLGLLFFREHSEFVVVKNMNKICTGRPCIFSWPVLISNSVNEFFVAV